MTTRSELAELLGSVLSEHCDSEVVAEAEGGWAARLWSVLDGLGLTAVGIAESDGGSGGDLRDVATIVQTAAGYAAPVPLVGTLLLAPWLRSQFGLPHRSGASAVATGAPLTVTPHAAGWRIAGRVDEVAYGHVVDNVLLLGVDEERRPVAVEVEASALDWELETNLAGEPRDAASVDIKVPELAVLSGDRWDGLYEEQRDREALGVSWAVVGALRTVQELTVRYTTEREQFGRPVSRFQAVRQLAAVLAGEVTVSSSATTEATRRILAGHPSSFAIAASRARVASAATEVARIAHQLHGAIGYTREYPLHQYTRRLWSWRDEGLSHTQWTQLAGLRALAEGPDRVWATMTG